MLFIHEADFGFVAFWDVADISTFDIGGFGTSGTVFSKADRCDGILGWWPFGCHG